MATSQPTSLLPKYFQDPEMTQEYREFIYILLAYRTRVDSKETPSVSRVLVCKLVDARSCSIPKKFQAHDTDILLGTIPKAGTTWLKALSFALVNWVHYPDPELHPLLTNNVNPHSLVPFLEVDIYNKKEVPDFTSSTSPRLFSTHLPYSLLPISATNSTCKIVYLCRNPKDTVVSFWHFTNKLSPTSCIGTNSLEDALDMFCRGVSIFGPYWDHVLGYWKESLEKPQNVLFLKFEEMKEQPIANLKRLVDFLGFPFSSEEEVKGVMNDIYRLCSFDLLSNLEVNKNGKRFFGGENNTFFRQGEVGD